jgi:predicted lipoprotein with Yx(FWY)xxD motif
MTTNKSHQEERTIVMSLSKLSTSSRRRMLPALLAAAAAGAVLAACGSPGGSPSPGGPGPYGPGGSVQAARPPASGGAALMLERTSLGIILTDGRGFTVYAFEADRGTTSRCTGACAAAWPPVITSAARVMAAGGADESLAGEITRAGGARQVTYAGHPLYRYAGDAIPGAITGQGSDAFGARWDVLTAAGTKVTTAWPLCTTVRP